MLWGQWMTFSVQTYPYVCSSISGKHIKKLTDGAFPVALLPPHQLPLLRAQTKFQITTDRRPYKMKQRSCRTTDWRRLCCDLVDFSYFNDTDNLSQQQQQQQTAVSVELAPSWCSELLASFLLLLLLPSASSSLFITDRATEIDEVAEGVALAPVVRGEKGKWRAFE